MHLTHYLAISYYIILTTIFSLDSWDSKQPNMGLETTLALSLQYKMLYSNSVLVSGNFRLTCYTFHFRLFPLAIWHATYHRMVPLCEARVTLVADDGVDWVVLPATS